MVKCGIVTGRVERRQFAKSLHLVWRSRLGLQHHIVISGLHLVNGQLLGRISGRDRWPVLVGGDYLTISEALCPELGGVATHA